MVAGAGAVMALAMLGLFAVTAAGRAAPVVRADADRALLGLQLPDHRLLRPGRGQGRRWARGGHVRLAAWRETGALLGVCARRRRADALALGPNPPFEAFAILFAGACAGRRLGDAGEWRRRRWSRPRTGLRRRAGRPAGAAAAGRRAAQRRARGGHLDALSVLRRKPAAGAGLGGAAAAALLPLGRRRAFVQKAALALAAVVLLPALDAVGYSDAARVPRIRPSALQLLTWLYALVPCILKLGAMALLAATRLPEAPAAVT
jgi:hypothetical protein